MVNTVNKVLSKNPDLYNNPMLNPKMALKKDMNKTF